ncbi:phage integrase [Streptomyces sp. SPB074]|nr:phage integrase [Streptomyces sp. SPB074]
MATASKPRPRAPRPHRRRHGTRGRLRRCAAVTTGDALPARGSRRHGPGERTRGDGRGEDRPRRDAGGFAAAGRPQGRAGGRFVAPLLKGKRARFVPIVEEIRPLVAQRILTAGPDPDARLFTGPRGGRISTAVLRDATHWDEVVTKLGYEHLRRHDLRHTGLTWFADAGTPVHILRRIADHGSLNTTQRYLHPDIHKITAAGTALSAHLTAIRAPHPLSQPIAMTR